MTGTRYLRQGLTVGEVAAVLHLRAETIKAAVSSGALPSWQIVEGRGWRYCTPEAVEAFALARGLAVDWEALPDLPA